MISINYDETLQVDDELLKTIKKAISQSLITEQCPYSVDVYVDIVDEETILKINKETRDKNSVTDVLSFPMLEYEAPSEFPEFISETDLDLDTGNVYLGDIIICLKRAEEQAIEYGHSLEREIGFLTVHSMLHLFGYDHMVEEEEQLMRKRQKIILDEMGLNR